MKGNSDGNYTNVGSIGNSIEEDIKILEELRTHGYAMLLMKYEDRIKTNRKIDQALEHIVSDYKKVLKENEELKEKENKIYKEVQENLAFEKFLIVKERKPDLFNQGRFYISQIIYDILNDVQNPEGIHKENKCIQYIDYIPVQKVKDKIEELKQKAISYGTFIDKDESFNIQSKISVLQDLLERSREDE